MLRRANAVLLRAAAPSAPWMVMGLTPEWEVPTAASAGAATPPITPSAQWWLERRLQQTHAQSQRPGASLKSPTAGDAGLGEMWLPPEEALDELLGEGGSANRPYAARSTENLVQEMETAARCKQIAALVDMVREVHLRLALIPVGALGPRGGSVLVRILDALGAVPHTPMSLAFCNSLVRAFAEYGCDLTPHEASKCLGDLSKLDVLYHRDILSTLITVVWTALEDPKEKFDAASLENIGEGLRLVEDLLTREELQTFCRRLLAAADEGYVNISMCIAYLARLKSNAAVLLLGPQIEAFMIGRAPTMQAIHLMPSLSLAMRFVHSPSAVAMLVALIERFLRIVTQQARNDGSVDLGFALQFMSSVDLPAGHALCAPWQAIAEKAITEIERCMRFSSPPQAHDVAVLDGAASCRRCGSALPWPTDEAPYCVHACNVVGIHPLSLDAHIDGLLWLCTFGAGPKKSDFSVALVLWLANRLTPAVLDKMSSGMRARVGNLIDRLSEELVLLPSGSLSLPVKPADDLSPLGASTAALLTWQTERAVELNAAQPFVSSRTLTAAEGRRVNVAFRILQETVKEVRRSRYLDRSRNRGQRGGGGARSKLRVPKQ